MTYFLFKNTIQELSIGDKFKTTNNIVINEKGNKLFDGCESWQTNFIIEELINWYNNENNLPPLLK